MATLVIMPRQGQSVESCIITAFNKKVGDTVEVGETLFSYETDKSSFDEPAPAAGKILAIFREEGDDVPCLENVLVIGNEGDGVSRLVREKCDFIASIPMKGDIDSLNASVATGVLAYEIVRQRLGK